MKNRGMGHVEVVLASVLFISAIIFILSFVDIENDTDAGEAALSLVNSLFQKETHTEVVTYSILVKKTSGDPPGPTPNIINIELPEDIKSEQEIRAETIVSGNLQKLPAQKHPTNPRQVVVNRGNNDVTLIYIILSEEIESAPASLTLPANEPAYYQVLSRSEDNMLAETKMRTLQASYEGDYIALRQIMGMGERINFGVSATWFNPEIKDPATQVPKQDFIKAERDIPTRVDVTARNVRQKILLQDGQRVFADIIIKAW